MLGNELIDMVKLNAKLTLSTTEREEAIAEFRQLSGYNGDIVTTEHFKFTEGNNIGYYNINSDGTTNEGYQIRNDNNLCTEIVKISEDKIIKVEIKYDDTNSYPVSRKLEEISISTGKNITDPVEMIYEKTDMGNGYYSIKGYLLTKEEDEPLELIITQICKDTPNCKYLVLDTIYQSKKISHTEYNSDAKPIRSVVTTTFGNKAGIIVRSWDRDENGKALNFVEHDGENERRRIKYLYDSKGLCTNEIEYLPHKDKYYYYFHRENNIIHSVTIIKPKDEENAQKIRPNKYQESNKGENSNG